ncbi:MAG: hypothetical protein H6Q52_2335 [Deltaproteobacteria bacterium]|nr:hypothetical protein [Deltaproteobacteria bacterium]
MWKIPLAFMLFVSLNLLPADAAPDRPPEAEKQQSMQKNQQAEEQIIVPPFNIPEKDVVDMKEKIQRLKPVIEKDSELSRLKIVDIDEIPGIVPKVRLAFGYGTVLRLPFVFSGDDVAIGAREKFTIEIKDGALVIFPVREFKSTNLIVFEKKDETSIPHHYLLVEDGASGEADLTVNVKRLGTTDLASATDAMVHAIMTQQLPEKGSAGEFLLEGRSPVLTKLDAYPFIRMMRLTKPDRYIFMIAGKVTPVGEADFWIYPGNNMSIIASHQRELTVRRIIDGKIFKNTR